MIAKILDEAVLLHKGSRDALASAMKELNGRIIPGTVKAAKTEDIGYWFRKDFYDPSYKRNGSLLCFSYISKARAETDGNEFSWYIYLFSIYDDGEKHNMERQIGSPFHETDTVARKNSEAYMRNLMRSLTRLPDMVRIYTAIFSSYFSLIHHDWSKGIKS